jgi:hypothetical protein
LTPNITGSAVNVEPPQNLAAASQQASGSVPNQQGNSWFPLFSELYVPAVPYTSPYLGLRAGYNCSTGTPVYQGNGYTAATAPSPSSAYEQGLPPGNYNYLLPNQDFGTFNAAGHHPGAATTTGNLALFTDLVFDIPTAAANGTPYQATPWQGFSFTNPTSGTWVSGNITSNKGSVPLLVEGARGNLESTAVMNKALGYWNPSGTVNTNLTGGAANTTAKPSRYGLAASAGIYQAYWSYVVNNAQPMATARVAAYEFFQTMHISANSHFGLICFTDAEANPLSDASSSLENAWEPNSLYSGTAYPANDYHYNIDGYYKLGNGGATPGAAYVAGDFLVPGAALDSSNDNWANGNVQQILLGSVGGTAFPVCTINGNAVTYNNESPQWTGGATQNPSCIVPLGYTDITGALTSAYTDVTTNSRTNATNRAIVLFTDGVPDLPSYTSGSGSAIGEGATIGGAGIPIYTIGLATNTAIQQYEDDTLSDNVNAFGGDSAAKGIAWAASNAGAGQSEYFPALTTTLNTAFQAVARSLCVLQ